MAGPGGVVEFPTSRGEERKMWRLRETARLNVLKKVDVQGVEVARLRA